MEKTTMKRKHRKYDQNFKKEAFRMLSSGRSVPKWALGIWSTCPNQTPVHIPKLKSMKRLFATFIIIILAFVGLSAQSGAVEAKHPKQAYNNFYAEYKGPTGWYSVNYERILRHKKVPFCFLAAGIGFYTIDYEQRRWRAYPCRVKLGFGWQRLFGEIGYCNNFARVSKNSWLHPDLRYPFSKRDIKFVTFGLRYQPLHRGLYVGVEAFPINFSDHGDKYTFAWHLDKDPDQLEKEGKKRFWWGGLSLGYSF